MEDDTRTVRLMAFPAGRGPSFWHGNHKGVVNSLMGSLRFCHVGIQPGREADI